MQLEVEGTRARALVRQADPKAYRVGLEWSRVPEKRALHVFCECPSFTSGEICEHVWSVLVAVDREAPDSQPPGGDRVSLRRDRPDRWGDLGVEPEGKPPSQEPQPRSRVQTARPRGRRGPATGPPGTSAWRALFAAVRDGGEEETSKDEAKGPAQGVVPDGLRFLINVKDSVPDEAVLLDVFLRRNGPGGKPGRFRRSDVDPESLPRILLPPSVAERRDSASAFVAGFSAPPPSRSRGKRGKATGRPGIQQVRLPPSLYHSVLPHLASNDALGWWDGRRPGGGKDLDWDDSRPWKLSLHLEETSTGTMRLEGTLERNSHKVSVSDPLLVLRGEGDRPSLMVVGGSLARLETRSPRDLQWITRLREANEIIIPRRDLEEAYAELFDIPDLPELGIPDELSLSKETENLQPRLVLSKDDQSVLPDPPLIAELSFLYGDVEVGAGDTRSTVVDWSERRMLKRDLEGEHKALVRLLESGARPLQASEGHQLEVRRQEVPSVAEPLLADGWIVEVQGRSVRSPNPPSMRIESGMDWFELSGSADFDGDEIDMKEILDAVSRGDRFVRLKDGSAGLLPSAWTETYGSLAELAHEEGEGGNLRFLSSQALLVDSLLVEMPPAAVDEAFSKLREKLSSFESIKPKKEPRSFKGTLRGYQREGLGWLDFLREYGLGGVLADDMGLGKTVQVLALMRAHRTKSKSTGLPYLVVVPRSLLYNWIDEANRFTPDLKVVEYGGPGREALHDHLEDYDVIVTTYGTLRRDVGFLATVEFDTIILDEAQAIKNRDSQGAKAARLLQADHRLALTGTPIENHLGELGSIFEFLNPGLLGQLPTLEALMTGRAASKSELERIRQGIRPFILRRTKAHVLKDLPPKTEQILHTTLNDRQRELYDQLRASFQQNLLASAEGGKPANHIEVLAALLRLRQIACHPGLVRDEWADAGSAKLDTVFELVGEVLEEGHKAIVFSQFTKLLGFVRQRLDEQGLPYAYLDGQTRNRRKVVEQFQKDPNTNLFLISLKAGGVGLNLTAAGYVFLLDPWWNPAVEAQAIDRAHRIGQTQPVFAYRLIAQDTVEEKILQLQKAKRQIADAVLEGEEGEEPKELTAKELRMLLS